MKIEKHQYQYRLKKNLSVKLYPQDVISVVGNFFPLSVSLCVF